jgi:hypothetical protein
MEAFGEWGVGSWELGVIKNYFPNAECPISIKFEENSR